MTRTRVATVAVSAAIAVGSVIAAPTVASAHTGSCVTHAQFLKVKDGQSAAHVRRELGRPSAKRYVTGVGHVRFYDGCAASRPWVAFEHQHVTRTGYVPSTVQ